jgi:KAP family P-loop domain
MNSLIKINAPHKIGVDISPNDGDLAFVSIDHLGTPERLNTMVIKSYGYSNSDLPNQESLKYGFGTAISKNHKPIIFVVDNGETFSVSLRKNLYNALTEFRGWFYGKKVWIPLMGINDGGLNFEESYQIMAEVINEFLIGFPTQVTFFISFPNYDESVRLLGQLNAVSNFTDLISQYTGNYFIGGATWGVDEDQSERFFNEGIWENGYNDKFIEVVNRVKEGDILFLKSTYAAKGISYLRLKGIGIIMNNVGDGIHLQVDWKITHELIDLGRMGKYRSTFARVMPNDVQTLLNAFGSQKIIDSELFEQVSDLKKTKNNYAELIADDIDGDDLFEIGKDVNAFAQVITTNSFKPPLAIALFGKWGAGKSFFMNQLRKRIDLLAKIEDKDSPYCKGVSQIHFNAWSYLDSNLWAGIVTRIFEGLAEYISNDTKANEYKREIGETLSKELNITKEEILFLEKQKETVQEEIDDYEEQKEKLNKDLQKSIGTIENKTLQDIVSAVDEQFNVREKIQEVFQSNPSIELTTKQFSDIIPEKYWNNPRELYNQLRSFKTFLFEFFSGKDFVLKTTIILFVLALLLILPSILTSSLDSLKNVDMRIPQVGLSLLISIIALGKRTLTIYRRLQPIIASFWNIKEVYEKQLNEALFSFEQQEKALRLQIEQTRKELEIVNIKIQAAETIKGKLEFKMQHALATEALYSFIDKKSKGDDYQKYTGIVSLIRSDFKILSELFLEHNKENVKGEAFRKHFDKPLERIVLYIDDLDRCPEDRVVQVLEAVNLLMAFPLFVVVVGVDPRWVRNALLLEYEWQFNQDIKEDLKNKGYKPIECSDYLEKIFQVPFHLKEASDIEVKEMLKKLSAPKINVNDDVYEMEDDSKIDTLQLGESQLGNFQLGQIRQKRRTTHLEKYPTSLNLTKHEVELLQEFSAMIGNNPRAIKRFINIYQIVRAHEELILEGDDQDYIAIMFFLAFSVGPLKSMTKDLLIYIEKSENKAKSPHSYLVNLVERTELSHNMKEKVKSIMDRSIIFSKTRIPHLKKYASFIQRFTFEDSL